MKILLYHSTYTTNKFRNSLLSILRNCWLELFESAIKELCIREVSSIYVLKFSGFYSARNRRGGGGVRMLVDFGSGHSTDSWSYEGIVI